MDRRRVCQHQDQRHLAKRWILPQQADRFPIQSIGRIDFDGLLSDEGSYQPVGVLNGIAYDAADDRLFVTGKYWPTLFEIELEGVYSGD